MLKQSHLMSFIKKTAKPSVRRGSSKTSRTFHLEALESRVVMSTIVVTNANDKGTGSLRDAISKASTSAGADVITFDKTAFAKDQTIKVSSPLTIKDASALSIEGPTGSSLKIDGQSKYQIFNITSTATLKNLTLAAGDANKGGALYAKANLTLDTLVVTDSSAKQGGGGLYLDGTGTYSIKNSIFTNNESEGSGGAVLAAAAVTFDHCVFNDNRGAQGGAISGAHVTVSNSQFSLNRAEGTGGAISGDYATLTFSTFTKNESGSKGGAVQSSSATVESSTFDSNRAEQAGGAIQGQNNTIRLSSFVSNQTSKGSGGALDLHGSTVESSTFTGNTAEDNGGAISGQSDTILTSTFQGNSAEHGSGGALSLDLSTLRLLTLTENVADSQGGAAHLSSTTLTNSTVVGNTVKNSKGAGGVYLNGLSVLSSNIISGNKSGGADPDLIFSSTGGANTNKANTNNLIGVGGSGIAGIKQGLYGNLIGTAEKPINPLLGTLKNNGGPTSTMLPQAGSPAINTGASNGLTTDQNGKLFIATPDIGSSESETISWVVTDGWLTLTGTAGVDTITVGRRSSTQLFVTTAIGTNPSTTVFLNEAGIKGIHLVGGAGNDGLYLNAEIALPAVIEGGDGDDSLRGGSGNDVLLGGAGNDLLKGGTGDDSLDGSSGSDNLQGQGGNDLLLGGIEDASPNQLDGGDGADTIYGSDGADNILGGYNNGLDGADTIYGLGGDDIISSAAGDDIVYGGAGNDSINGGAGNDVIFGELGDDFLQGVEGNDIVVGGKGADTVTGGDGDDILIGGEGVDKLDGEGGCNIVVGGSTTYDGNLSALQSIQAVWTRSDLTFDVRVQQVSKGVGVNGAAYLDFNTLIDDLAVDVIKTTKAASNWIFS